MMNNIRRGAGLFLWGSLFAAVATAQYPPPTIWLSPDTSNPPAGCDPGASQTGYTCNPTVDIQWKMPQPQIDCQDCQYEYCVTQQTPPVTACDQQQLWENYLITSSVLSQGNGTNVVYALYRFVQDGGVSTASAPGSASIILNTTAPMVFLNSPTGVLGGSGPAFAQAQVINSDNAQWITYFGYSSVQPPNPPESVTFGIAGCPSCGSNPLISGLGASTYAWVWPGSTSPPPYTYLQVTDTDQAGNLASTVTPPGTPTTGLFTLFSASAGYYVETCDPAGPLTCTFLADGSNGGITGDPPSDSMPPMTTCDGTKPIAFSGYADPSMRADTLINPMYNPYGTDLWMLYSYPRYWSTGADTLYCDTGVVETHLAESDTSQGIPGGTDWGAYCGTTCPKIAPIWPTEPFCPSQFGTATCYKTCAAVPGAYHGTCFSSHEVPNFWIAANYPSTGHETWFTAHLMYWVGQGTSIYDNAVEDGCLVVSVAEDPQSSLSAVGWPSGSGPSQCPTQNNPVTFPANNAALTFTTLTTAVQAGTGVTPPCLSWGEPAIMLYNGTLYLAALCIGQSIGPGTQLPNGLEYYVFSSAPSTNVNQLSWTYFSGPFTYMNLPGYPNFPFITVNSGQPVNSITELDWNLSADGSTIIVVVTPEYALESGESSTPFQYGCVAVTFDVHNGFQKLIAYVNDMTPSSPYPAEFKGSNGCTYDPMSNTGIAIVRYTLGSSQNSNNAQNQYYSIMNTGVLP